MDHRAVFNALFPGFFSDAGIRALDRDHVFTELALDLKRYTPRPPVPCPEGITFGAYDGDMELLRAAVRKVDGDWVKYFDGSGRYFAAFEGGRIVSFCILDEMGRCGEKRIGGPGCVGTLPEYRGHQIGLKMVQLATGILQRRGFDIAYIHYTHIDHWYAKLGYKTVLRWNRDGVLWDQGDEAGADLS